AAIDAAERRAADLRAQLRVVEAGVVRLLELRMMLDAARRREAERQAPATDGARMDALTPEQAAASDRRDREAQRRAAEDIRSREYFAQFRLQTGTPALPGDSAALAQGYALYQREVAERRARMSLEERAFADFLNQLLLVAGAEVGGLALGGLRATRLEGGGVRVTLGDRAVELSPAEAAALRPTPRVPDAAGRFPLPMAPQRYPLPVLPNAPAKPGNVPPLTAANPRDALHQAYDAVNRSGLDPQGRAAMMEQYIRQIESQFRASHNWQLAAREVGTDGSVIFSGQVGEAVVVSPSGEIFTGRLVPGAPGFQIGPRGEVTPLYPNLRKR
ncbi:MAG: hypothetical protein K2X87_18640, partial [Gemmataceae bacterium]|nr:hypothetical protein [Gemmataceae bacterium]